MIYLHKQKNTYTRVLYVAFVMLICACGLQEIDRGANATLPAFGNVFVCDLTIGQVGLCWKDDDVTELEDALNATCYPTQRHAGPCIYQCPSARGCNALDGCYCPEAP